MSVVTNFNQDPIINVVHKGIRRGIDVAIENRCLGSAVILILSAIDAMAYLSMPEGQQDVTKSDFVKWAERYLQFPGNEQLTGLDLYGARCAMLHSYGSRSRISQKGECRMVGYMDRSNPPIRYNPSVSTDLVLVAVPALRDALFQGIDRFLIDVYKNADSIERRLAEERFQTLVYAISTTDLPKPGATP